MILINTTTLILNGNISANGQPISAQQASVISGGSGGSILIHTNSLTGSGNVSSNGAAGGYHPDYFSPTNGGGGTNIHPQYNNNFFFRNTNHNSFFIEVRNNNRFFFEIQIIIIFYRSTK